MFLIVSLGALLRFWDLDRKPLWVDELAWLDWSTRPAIADIFHGNIFPHSPFFALIGWPFRHWMTNDTAPRCIPALLGTATIPLLFTLGRDMFNARVGVMAAAALAIIPIHVMYSRQVEPYTLAVFLTTLYAWLLWRTRNSTSLRAWVCVALSAAGAVYAHMFAVFAVALMAATVCLIAMRRREQWHCLIPLGIALGTAALLYVPWLIAGPTLASTWVSEIPRDVFKQTYSASSPLKVVIVSFLSSCWRGDEYVFSLLTPPFLLGLAVLGLSAFLTLKSRVPALLFVALWASSMSCVAVTVYAWGYLLHGRYMMSAMPASCILIAVGVENLSSVPIRFHIRRYAAIAVSTVAVSSLALLSFGATMLVCFGIPYQDTRGMVRVLDEVVAPNDAIVTSIWNSEMIFRHYKSPLLHRVINQPPGSSIERLAGQLDAGKRVWFLYWWDFPNEVSDFIKSAHLKSIDLCGGGWGDHIVTIWPPGDEVSDDSVIDTAWTVLATAVKYSDRKPEVMLLRRADLAGNHPRLATMASEKHLEIGGDELATLSWFAPTDFLLRETLQKAGMGTHQQSNNSWSIP